MRDAPAPTLQPTQVLVATRASLISSGTERYVRGLASSSLLAKARARPDLVRKVIDRAKTHGLASTFRAVRGQLAEEMPLGYSGAGVVVEVGEMVTGIRPGMRVATAGAGHAELQLVAGQLAAPMPDQLSFDEAAFGAVGSIALHGVRLAGIEPGDRVLVIGLGLVGQITGRLALAAGASVAGIDLDPWRLQVAAGKGVITSGAGEESLDVVNKWSQGVGADRVIVTAASKSSAPMHQAAELARDRGVITLVGDVGLELDRRPLYEKELTLQVARSYGPGRYEPSYESWGVDYPPGQVRWTAGRNVDAVLQLVGDGRLELEDLITHRFPFTEAVDAYQVLSRSDENQLAILLEYEPAAEDESEVITLKTGSPAQRSTGSSGGAGLVGAGKFAANVLVPAAIEAGFTDWTAVASAAGASAERLGRERGFRRAVQSAEAVIDDPDTGVVFVASRHDSHAGYVIRTLEAGKHVFCEKPLAITEEELQEVSAAWRSNPGTLMVGFNRRWSPAVEQICQHFGGRSEPVQILYRANAGALPDDHWLKDRRMGGRLIGEACHFVDTCAAIVGSSPTSVYAIGSGRGEAILEEEFTVVLGYSDGSQAIITYTAGGPSSVNKESLEVIGSGRHAMLDDYGSLLLAGRTGSAKKVDYKPPDKGHAAELRVFKHLVEGRSDGAAITEASLATTQATLAAVRSLVTGRAVRLESG